MNRFLRILLDYLGDLLIDQWNQCLNLNKLLMKGPHDPTRNTGIKIYSLFSWESKIELGHLFRCLHLSFNVNVNVNEHFILKINLVLGGIVVVV